MLQQVIDLQEEGADLAAFLGTLSESDWGRPTPFKDWTINEVVGHLHGGDWLAYQSLTDPERFAKIRSAREASRDRGEAPPAGMVMGPDLATGSALLEQWQSYFEDLCAQLGAADPKARMEWIGPDMSVRMCATARQMETWAHGQDVFDLLRKPRTHRDRVKNIAEIGVRTFNWTFVNRGEPIPGPMPYVRLIAPSGATWEWGEANEESRVEGSAVEFAHVVTQGRNIQECELKVVGDVAKRWMDVAQCFAGPPREPPEPGVRGWA